MPAEATIETPHLRITPFTEAHLTERYVGWLNEPEVVRFSDQRHRVHTPESCRAYLASFAGSPHFFWAVEERPSGLHIGNLNAYVEAAHSVADVGIVIGERSVRGRGRGFEAWMGVCDYLLRERRIRKVTAGALAVNEPMLRIMRRAGMVEDGIRKRHHLWEGREVDVIHAALFRDQWIERFPRGPFADATP